MSRWVLSQDRTTAVGLQTGIVLAVVRHEGRFELRAGHLAQGALRWTLGRFPREADAQHALLAAIAGSTPVYWVEDLSPILDAEWSVS